MTQTPSTGTQLLERILIQLEYQSAELIGINSRLDTMNENLSVCSSSNGTSENGQEVFVFEMQEVNTGISEQGYTQVTYIERVEMISSDDIVLKDAFTLLSKAKNSEEI